MNREFKNHNEGKICPRCGSKDIIPIQYGLPPKEPCGKKVGGCIIREDNPKWYCINCKNEF